MDDAWPMRGSHARAAFHLHAACTSAPALSLVDARGSPSTPLTLSRLSIAPLAPTARLLACQSVAAMAGWPSSPRPRPRCLRAPSQPTTRTTTSASSSSTTGAPPLRRKPPEQPSRQSHCRRRCLLSWPRRHKPPRAELGSPARARGPARAPPPRPPTSVSLLRPANGELLCSPSKIASGTLS